MFYAYVIEGKKEKNSEIALKIGQTQDFNQRLKQLNTQGSVEPRAVFECNTREDAEIIEAVLRSYYIERCYGQRIGNDWIGDVTFNANFYKDNYIQAFLNILCIKKVIFFKKKITYKEITKKI